MGTMTRREMVQIFKVFALKSSTGTQVTNSTYNQQQSARRVHALSAASTHVLSVS